MRVLALVALAGLASSASAGVAFFSGDTTGGPTFARPLSLTGTSGTGSNVNYQVTPFFVSAAGEYTFEAFFPTHDGYIHAYATDFNPATPLVNLLGGDDDFSGAFTHLPGSGTGLDASKLGPTGSGNGFGGMALSAGVQYYAVVNAFSNGNAGPYDAAIGGPGDVTIGLVPAPASLALVGLGGLVAGRRRR